MQTSIKAADQPLVVLADSDCGWTCALTETDIATPRKSYYFHVCSNVNRTRHANQITACVLFESLMSAYENVNSENVAHDTDVGLFNRLV